MYNSNIEECEHLYLSVVWLHVDLKMTPKGNFIGKLGNSMGIFKIPHKCSHTHG